MKEEVKRGRTRPARKEGAPELLVIASAPEDRNGLARCLGSRWRTGTLRPEAIGDRVAWLDACAAVAVLEGGSGDEAVARLEAIRELPAGRALVLLAQDADDALLDRAIERLAPLRVLDRPASAAALHFAVDQVMPPEPVGAGARPGQRRAPALLGVSAAIRDVLEQVRRVAASKAPVLILGETGTGKELVARSLHEHGPRRTAPFVPVNCGALPEALLESELFGFAPGAFTGAEREKMGLFEQASGGTLFLDEIGDTSLALQVKLLRALESGEIRRLGETRVRPVDVRLVSATHRDLERMVEEESFRQDLYYRLNTVSLLVPPLRRRPVDVPFLAQHFAEELGAGSARRIALADDFLDALTGHEFPGNVRELRNAVERAIAMAAPGEPVSARHLPESFRSARARRPEPASGTLRERVDRLERETIRATLEQLGGNRTRAAEQLGLSRPGLRQKMRRLGLEESPER